MSSTTMRSLRQILVTVRATDPSAFAFPIAVVRVSRVNQATRRSFSIAAWARASTRCDLPVPTVIHGSASRGPSFRRSFRC